MQCVGNITNSEFCLLFHKASGDDHGFLFASWPELIQPLHRVHTSHSFHIWRCLPHWAPRSPETTSLPTVAAGMGIVHHEPQTKGDTLCPWFHLVTLLLPAPTGMLYNTRVSGCDLWMATCGHLKTDFRFWFTLNICNNVGICFMELVIC